MKSYLGMFKMSFKGELQYRARAFSGILTQFFWGVMYVYLYTAFMGGNVIDGFSLPQMASYVWLGQAVLQCVLWIFLKIQQEKSKMATFVINLRDQLIFIINGLQKTGDINCRQQF